MNRPDTNRIKEGKPVYGAEKHVVKGMAWTFAEKALTAVFQMFVGLVLMNFLFPDDYGTIQILVVFTSVCSVFVDSGFPQR